MAPKAQPLEAGTAAPDFKVKTHDGQDVSLKALQGQKVVLYFYPKDDTPGCVKQACNLRDNLTELADKGITVIGVSPDDHSSHEKFTNKYELTFPLIADSDRSIIDAYGVWGERMLYGKPVIGLTRTTFLIDEHGIIQHVFKRPKTDDHTNEILSKI